MVTCDAPRHAVSRGAGWKHQNMTQSAVLPRPGGYGQNGPQSGTSFFPQVFAMNHKIYGGVGGSEETKTAEDSGGLQLNLTLTDHNP